jgi:hypothetical protein
MDRYLEGSEWMSFHAEFCVEIARQLRPKFRPRYTAQPIKRIITDDGLTIISGTNWETKNIFPDVGIRQLSQTPLPVGGAGPVIAEPSLRAATIMPEQAPQYAVEIRDVEERQLVTLIELLSPANKQGEGYDEYITKRRHVLLSAVHLLEIDLLRKGQRVPMRQSLPDKPYFVFLSRAEKRPMTEIWAIALNQPLPVIPVPLRPGDDDVPLDLAAAFTSVYDSVGYDLLIDYTKRPDIPFDKGTATVAQQILSESTRSI